jgi:MYXO-CTERM domain-containing protein
MRHPSHPALRLRLPLPLPLTLLPGGLLCRYHLRKLRIILQHLHHARSACSTSTATSALPLPLLLLLLLLLHERRELLIIQRMRELRAGEGRSRRAIMLLLRLVGWLGHEH